MFSRQGVQTPPLRGTSGILAWLSEVADWIPESGEKREEVSGSDVAADWTQLAS